MVQLKLFFFAAFSLILLLYACRKPTGSIVIGKNCQGIDIHWVYNDANTDTLLQLCEEIKSHSAKNHKNIIQDVIKQLCNVPTKYSGWEHNLYTQHLQYYILDQKLHEKNAVEILVFLNENAKVVSGKTPHPHTGRYKTVFIFGVILTLLTLIFLAFVKKLPHQSGHLSIDKSLVKELLEQGKIEEAVELLPAHKMRHKISLKFRLSRINRQHQLGTITDEQWNVHLNKIAQTLIDLFDI